MRRYFKNLFYLSFTVFSFFTVSYLCKHATHGFSELSIIHRLENGVSSLPEELKNLNDKKFHYLGKGAQAFAFVSEDHQYVIKFLRFDHLLPKFIVRLFSFVSIPYIQDRILKSRREIDELLTSFQIAQNELSESTGVLHFQKKQLTVPLKFIDRIGVNHSISKAPFIVQPYAPSLESVLDSLNEIQVQKILDQVIDYSMKRMNLKIRDKDPNLLTNFGLLNEKLVEFDVGRFYKIQCDKTLEQKKDEIRDIVAILWPKLNDKFPNLKAYFESKLDTL